MLNKAEIEALVTEALNQEDSGCADIEIYDFEFTPGQSRVCRLFIAHKTPVAGSSPSIDDVVRVNKVIRRIPELLDFTQLYSVEVSTPGINRQLKRPEHYLSAVGLPVSITLKMPDAAGRQNIDGELASFSEDLRELVLVEQAEVTTPKKKGSKKAGKTISKRGTNGSDKSGASLADQPAAPRITVSLMDISAANVNEKIL